MPGTVGNKVLSGEKVIQIDSKDVAVNMQVFNMSFSAHADSKGIMELLTHLEPKNVFLVHGEKQKMKILAENVRQKLNVPCYFPPNHSVTVIETDP
jgi:integrator complex subunit 11